MAEGDIHFENGSRIYFDTGRDKRFIDKASLYTSKNKIASAKCQEFDCERSYVLPLLNALAPHTDFSVKKVNEVLDVLIPEEITLKELELIQLTLQKNLESVQRDGVSVYEVDGCIFVNRDEEIIIEQEIADYINDLIIESAQEEVDEKVKKSGGNNQPYYGSSAVTPTSQMGVSSINHNFSATFEVTEKEKEDIKNIFGKYVSKES